MRSNSSSMARATTVSSKITETLNSNPSTNFHNPIKINGNINVNNKSISPPNHCLDFDESKKLMFGPDKHATSLCNEDWPIPESYPDNHAVEGLGIALTTNTAYFGLPHTHKYLTPKITESSCPKKQKKRSYAPSYHSLTSSPTLANICPLPLPTRTTSLHSSKSKPEFSDTPPPVPPKDPKIPFLHPSSPPLPPLPPTSPLSPSPPMNFSTSFEQDSLLDEKIESKKREKTRHLRKRIQHELNKHFRRDRYPKKAFLTRLRGGFCSVM